MANKTKENHTKPLRLFKIEQAIQNLGYPSVERLQKELEVSRRTILRDIDELKIYYNAPIEYDRMRKGYYYSDNTYFVNEGHPEIDVEIVGVCVGEIQKKLGLTQSTTSHYLAILQKANLLTATRIGKWTYYRRNEETISQLCHLLEKEI